MNKKTWRVVFPCCFFRLIGGAINRDINITIFVYVPAERFKRVFFPLKLPDVWMFLEGKYNWYLNSLTKRGGNKVFRSRPRDAMLWVLQTLNLALSHNQSCDCVMPRARNAEILLLWKTLSESSILIRGSYILDENRPSFDSVKSTLGWCLSRTNFAFKIHVTSSCT